MGRGGGKAGLREEAARGSRVSNRDLRRGRSGSRGGGKTAGGGGSKRGRWLVT